MKSEILKPTIRMTGVGIIYFPAIMAFSWLAHSFLYILTGGGFALYDHPPRELLQVWASPDNLELFAVFSIIVAGVYSLQGAMMSFRYYQMMAHFCRKHSIDFRELSYFNKDQLADALNSLSILEDGNYVTDGAEKFFFCFAGDSFVEKGKCVEISFEIYHAVRIGKYSTVDVKNKLGKKKWKRRVSLPIES